MIRVLLCLPLLASCSTLVDDGHRVECHADECPTDGAFTAMVAHFDGRVPGFDRSQSVVLEWWPEDHRWDIRGRPAKGYAYPAADRIATTHECGVFHELMHVHLWRATGDGDPTHETAPGPWDSAATAAIDELCDAWGGDGA